MKFAAVVVLLAVVLGANASTVALGPWSSSIYAPYFSTGVVAGQTWDGVHNGLVLRNILNNGQWHEGVWGDRSGWTGQGAWNVPTVVPTSGATVFSAGPGIIPTAFSGWAPEGSYLAQTRGSLHTAPLSGHTNSVTSINLEPAPGTV